MSGKQQLTLTTNHGLAVAIPFNYPSNLYQIIRQTRPISGEPLVNLPQNVAVDLSVVQNLLNQGKVGAGVQIPQRPNAGAGVMIFEILFGAGGNVINFNGNSAAMALVIRDITINPITDPPPANFDLDPNYARVLGINPRTGSVSAQAVAPKNVTNLITVIGYALTGTSGGL